MDFLTPLNFTDCGLPDPIYHFLLADNKRFMTCLNQDMAQIHPIGVPYNLFGGVEEMGHW